MFSCAHVPKGVGLFCEPQALSNHPHRHCDISRYRSCICCIAFGAVAHFKCQMQMQHTHLAISGPLAERLGHRRVFAYPPHPFALISNSKLEASMCAHVCCSNNLSNVVRCVLTKVYVRLVDAWRRRRLEMARGATPRTRLLLLGGVDWMVEPSLSEQLGGLNSSSGGGSGL